MPPTVAPPPIPGWPCRLDQVVTRSSNRRALSTLKRLFDVRLQASDNVYLSIARRGREIAHGPIPGLAPR